MRRSALLLNGFLLLIALVIFSSCEPEPIIEPTIDNPSINFVNEAPYLSGSATVGAGTWFEVKVSAGKGTELLKSVTVYEDDIKISDYTARLTYNGNPFEANPKLLSGIETESFSWVIGIKAHEDTNSTKSYRVEVTDDGRNFNSTEISISTEEVAPSFNLVEEAPYFWGDANVDGGTFFKVKISGSVGSSPMSTIEILEDDVTITDLTRVRYNGTDFTANPLDLSSLMQDSINAEISIKAHDTGGTKTYKVIVKDMAGNSDEAAITVSTGTPVTSMVGKLLLNAGGPDGTGGLNLMNGQGTGSNDVAAHIKDMGIDTDKPEADNWLQKIKGVNGSELRLPGMNTPEGFSFENIKFKEEIVGLYDNGTMITESDAVIVGDVFLVKNETNHFILKVTKVNVVTDGNDDSIEFSIKH